MIYVCFFLPVHLISLGDSLKINQIKVIGNKHTKTETILGIVKDLFIKSSYYDEESLRKAAKRGEERLQNTTWFYSAHIYVSPTKRKNFYNIVIEVKEGFLWRFYGGNNYFAFGKDNIWGNGEKFIAELGLKRQDVSIRINPISPSLFFNTYIGNINDVYYTKENCVPVGIQKIGIKTEIEYRINWDIFFTMQLGYHRVYNISYKHLFDTFYERVKFIIDKRNDIFSSTKGYYFLLALTRYNRICLENYTEVRYFFPITRELIICSKLTLAWQSPEIRDVYKFNIVGITGLRNDKYDTGMVGNVEVLNNLEIRYRILSVSFAGIFNSALEPVVFFDIGRCFRKLEDVAEVPLKDYPVVFGLGVRVLFYAPIFLPVRIEVGWNKASEPTIFLSLSMPFKGREDENF